jgi:hypothetical protein
VSAHRVCLSAVLPHLPGNTLLSAPKATQKGWVGVIKIPFFFISWYDRFSMDNCSDTEFVTNFRFAQHDIRNLRVDLGYLQ